MAEADGTGFIDPIPCRSRATAPIIAALFI
jgi:hypothetical protein